MISDVDIEFTRLAIDEAKMARENGNMPFGAVLVKDGKVVASGQNQVFTKSDHTCHAELGLIRDYCQRERTTDLSEYTLYSSCEPCVMCACPMIWTKLGRLVYSASKEALDSFAGKSIDVDIDQLFSGSTYKPIVVSGVLEEEGERVLEGYGWG